jgi:hypothetical protein
MCQSNTSVSRVMPPIYALKFKELSTRMHRYFPEKPMNNFNSFSRRRFIKLLTLGTISLPLIGHPARAAELSNLTKAATWRLGDDLSLAAMLYGQDKDPDTNQLFSKAKKLADALGVDIKPFPAKSSKSSSTLAEMIHYLIKGDGALIGVALGRKYDDEHEILYEVSVKSNLLLLLYAPGDGTANTIGDLVKSRSEKIGLPSRLWVGVVTAINNGRPVDEVRDAVFKMHEDVANYLEQGT